VADRLGWATGRCALYGPALQGGCPADLQEEIQTWKEVYEIDERYKAKCCGSDATDWLEHVRILKDTHGIDPLDSLALVQEQAKKSPVANSNFLKKAFLEGCNQAGLFNKS